MVILVLQRKYLLNTTLYVEPRQQPLITTKEITFCVNKVSLAILKALNPDVYMYVCMYKNFT